MFSLDLPTEDYEITLPHGVVVTVRPLDAVVLAAAEQSALRRAAALEAERADTIATGMPVDHLPDLSDPDLRHGTIMASWRRAWKVRDGLPQAAEDIVERQQGAPPELDDDGLLRGGEDAALRLARPHGRIGDAGSAAPLCHGLGVQAVLGGQGGSWRLRRLELGSNARRRSG